MEEEEDSEAHEDEDESGSEDGRSGPESMEEDETAASTRAARSDLHRAVQDSYASYNRKPTHVNYHTGKESWLASKEAVHRKLQPNEQQQVDDIRNVLRHIQAADIQDLSEDYWTAQAIWTEVAWKYETTVWVVGAKREVFRARRDWYE